ncbi:EAL domain-containing protein [Aliidiomarina quisquiliarum]|uniref:bifunctional diguanylate cyclase/phosphodiesterase n=1 Tax=Aliidiomarina quisquiliarum TaxID=2938947 RepID=UPI00208FC8DC|nr:EAL domain-containing protein [Aliidiomarina quisquiliarum]MCO4320717.1 EAL domain-containing protein [Aliidiomarina quisquiliarum]
MFILLFFWFVLQQTAQQGVKRSLAEQETTNSVLLHALEDTVVRSFQSVNSSMQTLAENMPQLYSELDINHVLKEQLRVSPQLRAIDLVDVHGLVIESVTKAKGGLVAYSCIETLRDEPLTEFLIELPQQGRYPVDSFAAHSVHEYVPMCVPVRDQQGQLAQVLIASINPQYFHNLFASITESLGASVYLYRYDGEQLLKTGTVETEVSYLLSQVMEKSWGQYRTQIGESNYLVSYRSTSLLPFIIVLTSDEDMALEAWKQDERRLRLFLLIISIITIIATLIITVLREKRNQAQGDIHLLSAAIRSTANAIFITNTHGEIHWTNNAFTNLTGYSFEEAQGKNPRMLNSGCHSKDYFHELWQAILSGNSWRGEVINRHKLGHTMVVEQTVTPILDAKGNIEHFIAVHEDVTARKNAEQQALYLADHDSLTGLPNRRYFERHLQQTFTYNDEHTEVGVIFLDLDRFKDVNDTMGHEAGDALLIHTASNLQRLINENHLLVRLGGDEFAILVKKVASREQLTSFASQVVRSVTHSFHRNDVVINITCSAGIATGNSKTSNVSQMMRQADMAMYRAKQAGKNTFRFFDEAMDALIKRRVYLQQQLELAISSDLGFSLRYQPQINTATGHVYGVEALMRWQTTKGEWVSPVEFIALAEETGQIIAIGIWLIKNQFQQMADWNRRGIQFGKVSMNISAVQLARDSLAERMISMMTHYAIPAEQLCIEITETTLMTNSDKVKDNLKQLNEAGIALSIDDFGTGYSSMSNLKAIDASQLKIDRSFIIGIGKRTSDEHIIRATIALAHSLDLKTVAEGVDSQAQLEFLKTLNCDYIQGYLFSKPLIPKDFEQFIAQGPVTLL